MRWIITVIFVVISFNNYLIAQSDSVKYTPDYEFKSGIYRTFEEFKNNDPSIPASAIIRGNQGEQVLISNLLGDEKIYYYNDNLHKKVRLRKGEFWGYCSHNVVYIYSNNFFNQLFRIGSISYFVETGNALFFNANDPVARRTHTFKYLDFRNGRTYDFNTFIFEELIKDDKELYDEFIGLKRKSKKKKAMYQFLNRYNERHPIYFPEVN